ncbi:MAG: hypothetical protein PHH06_03540 [Candidatus Gracilibacteria bacterium]|nr:hypothetical protein [Candidatus Gracilibacteria bacterium]
MTLVELIVSITLSVIIMFIVFQFVSDGLKSMMQSNIRTQTLDESFIFRDKLFRYFRGGYTNAEIISTGTVNDVLLLTDDDLSEGIVFGVVNRNTMMLEKDYIYGDNVIGYRELSSVELSNTLSDNSYVYTLNFFNDKLFTKMRIKDFNATLYNDGELINIYLSVILRGDTANFGDSFTGGFLSEYDILDFNLDF